MLQKYIIMWQNYIKNLFWNYMLCLWCKYLYIYEYIIDLQQQKKTIYLPIGCFAEKISSFARTKIIQLIFFYFLNSIRSRLTKNLTEIYFDLFSKKTCSSNSSTEESAKPRVLRFTWSMKTTSPLMPDQIMQKIREVLDQNNCDYEQRER